MTKSVDLAVVATESELRMSMSDQFTLQQLECFSHKRFVEQLVQDNHVLIVPGAQSAALAKAIARTTANATHSCSSTGQTTFVVQARGLIAA
jgi:hypothetical protein